MEKEETYDFKSSSSSGTSSLPPRASSARRSDETQGRLKGNSAGDPRVGQTKSHRYLLDVNPIRVLFNKLDRTPHSRARISVLEPTGSDSVSLEESSLQICLKASC